MDINTVLSNIIQEEILYFYTHIRNLDPNRKIDTAIADDVCKKALEYDMCNRQKKEVIRIGENLNDFNGTVIFAPSKDKPTLVVLSKKMLAKRDIAEIHGTVLHELTHATDYYDFADFLQISDYNILFDSPYYNSFFFWTEFHARRIGYKRFIEYKFIKGWKRFIKHRYEFLEGIKANFMIYSNKNRLYDLMQAIGRYYAFIELCPSHTNNFKEDILNGSVEPYLINILNEIYCFLSQNSEFEQFANNITSFNKLLNKIDLIVSEQRK